MGENGAGKSSLMNVLFGLYQPDAGEVRFDGAPVRLRTPADAMARGVGMVHQHFMLVPDLSVAENVVLGAEPTRRGLLDLDAAAAQVARTCAQYGFALDPLAKVGALSVASQQKVEIVRALHRDARTLILDEPTAVLTPQEAEELYRATRALAAQGRTVVFITHRLSEVLSVATRIAVMRRGRLVAEVTPAETTLEGLAAAMIGEGQVRSVSPPVTAEVLGLPVRERPASEVAGPVAPATPASEASASEPGSGAPEHRVLLRMERVSVIREGKPRLNQVSLEVRAGEIVGVAGVDGNGQGELAEVVAGLLAPAHGQVWLDGQELGGAGPARMRAHGVAHVPEDRLHRAVVKELSVAENLSLGRQDRPPFARGWRLDVPGRDERARALIRDFDVRPPDPSLAMSALSGGNQQKAVLARELDLSPRLLLAVQPTRGLDFRSVASIHARLRGVAARGAGVLLISMDLDELLALSDRLYVLYGGTVAGERARGDADAQELGRLMMGATTDA